MYTRSRSRRLAVVFLMLGSASFALEACYGDDKPKGTDDPTDVGDAGGTSKDAASSDGTSGTDGTVQDATNEAESDSAADVESDAVNDATNDATGDADGDASGDAASDGAIDANGDAALDAGVDAADASDAADAGPREEKVSVAACPWGLAVAGGRMVWTEGAGLGCSPAVRSCATTGCASLPAALFSGTSGQALPLGVVLVGANGPAFYTDNQIQHGGLWKMELDGGQSSWGPTVNGGGAVSDGTRVYWGTGNGLVSTLVASATTTTAIPSLNVAGSVNNGPHTIVVDGARVYAAADKNHIHSCALGAECTDGGTLFGTDTFSDGGAATIGGVATDGTNVFFTSGMAHYESSGEERLLRCPVAGCPGGVPELLNKRTTTNVGLVGSQVGVAVDAKNVYFGTAGGTIEYCAKTTAAPCTPTTLATGVRPFGFAIDGPYLYWADWRGGIYRILRP